jgi:alkylation response protein AidB-like acyl-CoA dehydrogenase
LSAGTGQGRTEPRDFACTQEHEELRQAVRRFLENESPEQAVRAQMVTERGYDEAVWSRMAEQVGLPGLIVPEEHGGSGLGAIEMAIVLEEMGRTPRKQPKRAHRPTCSPGSRPET